MPIKQISLWERLASRLPHKRRMIGAGETIATTGDPIGTILFPLQVVCVMARHDPYDRQPLASGMIGPEGFLGYSRILGNMIWRNDVLAVIGGDAIEVDADAFADAVEADRAVRALALLYLHNYTLQLTQNTIANIGHSVERRLARWLTMFHDRSVDDDLRLTHDTLAMLLNVRRASVTDSLHILEGELLVRCTRGRVTVRDRAGLQARAGYSYGYAEADYNSAIGPFGKASTG